MMTKKLMAFAFAMSFSLVMIAQQSIEPDQRLRTVYSDEMLESMKSTASATIEFLNFSLDHSWFLADESIIEKVSNSPYLYYVDHETGLQSDNKVVDADFTNFNIFDYYFEREHTRRTFYRIGDTGYIIGFYSGTELVEMFNASKIY